MIALLLIPLGLQMAAMLGDELYCHRRRGLPDWERLGHPLDTLSVLVCYVLALTLPPTREPLILYTIAAAFSCLFVTKDEFLHAKQCGGFEHWLHAILFVLHPVVLAAAAYFWIHGWKGVLLAQAGLTAAFGVYQLLYWNLRWAGRAAR